MVAQRTKKKKPPNFHEFNIKPPEPAYLKTPLFHQAAKSLRERIKTEGRIPDIEKTVSATVRAYGFPHIHYRSPTEPVEYLFLIDISHENDHQAGWYDTLTDTLIKDGIFVERWYFRSDPHVCFRKIGGETRFLEELHSLYPRHRLIFAGTGEKIIAFRDDKTAELSQVFQHWANKVILTPKATEDWTMTEVFLASEFIVLPGTLDGLAALTEHLKAPHKYRLEKWTPAEENIKTPETKVSIKSIKKRLGNEETFQWLCACAVWPELRWNLTLYLGHEFFPDSFKDEKSLAALIRLPWFREGNLPGDIRLQLLARLDGKDFEKIRNALINLIQNDPPEKQSPEYPLHRLRIASLQGDRKLLVKAIENINEEDIVRDHITLRLLESRPGSRLYFELPRRLHRMFYRHGISLLGLKTWVSLVPALLLALTAFYGIQVPKKPDIPPVKTNPVELKLAYIPPGDFMMGQSEEEKKRIIDQYGQETYDSAFKDETPRHAVKITRGFYMQTTEVTVGMWRIFAAETGYETEAEKGDGAYIWDGSNYGKKTDADWRNPYFSQTDKDPVTCISWNDARAFIDWLNRKTGENYRLPTEAEWEYAARATTQTIFAFGDCLSTDQANYNGNFPLSGCDKGEYREKTSPVGNLAANDWGLYDMHGNVWEWCSDWYGDYASDQKTDPAGPETGSYRVDRGGGWVDSAVGCRSAFRAGFAPGHRYCNLGFRLARSD